MQRRNFLGHVLGLVLGSLLMLFGIRTHPTKLNKRLPGQPDLRQVWLKTDAGYVRRRMSDLKIGDICRIEQLSGLWRILAPPYWCAASKSWAVEGVQVR